MDIEPRSALGAGKEQPAKAREDDVHSSRIVCIGTIGAFIVLVLAVAEYTS